MPITRTEPRQREVMKQPEGGVSGNRRGTIEPRKGSTDLTRISWVLRDACDPSRAATLIHPVGSNPWENPLTEIERVAQRPCAVLGLGPTGWKATLSQVV